MADDAYERLKARHIEALTATRGQTLGYDVRAADMTEMLADYELMQYAFGHATFERDGYRSMIVAIRHIAKHPELFQDALARIVYTCNAALNDSDIESEKE